MSSWSSTQRLIALAACGFSACSAQVMDEAAASGEAADQEVGVNAQALSWHHNAITWSYPQSPNPIWMWPESTHVCVLTRIAGKFRGRESVKLEVKRDPADGVNKWHLSGTGTTSIFYNSALSATARCFNKKDFVATIPSAGFSTTGFDALAWPTGDGDNTVCRSASVNAAFGDAFTSLAGLSGNLLGSGEFIRIEQASSWSLPNTVNVNACAAEDLTNPVHGYANAFRLDSFAPQNARFWGPNGKGTASQAGVFAPFALADETRAHSIGVPTEQAMCALVAIGGRMSGLGEYAEAFPHEDGTWWFRGQTLTGEYLFPRIRCFLRDQRPRAACRQSQINGCAAFGCGCVDAVCDGGACAGNGCTGAQEANCAASGRGCSLGQCQ
jgi:hypothetical protein